MDNKTDSNRINLADGSMILEAVATSAAELLKKGYKKIDKKEFARIQPIIGMIEGIGFQQWVGSAQAAKIKRVMEDSFRCIVDGSKVDKGHLAQSRENPHWYREMIHGKKGFSQHANWEPIEPSEATAALSNVTGPNIVAAVYLALSIATSQYYLHEINNNYKCICTELESIKEQFSIQDESEVLACQKTITDMVNHFDSIMENPNRCQNESKIAGNLIFDALKQIERSRLRIEKYYSLDSQKDKIDKVESNVKDMLQTLALMKTSVYVYGIAKGMKVCFDGVDAQDEVNKYIGEINEQITLYNQIVCKIKDTFKKYISSSKELSAITMEDVGPLAPFFLLSGPLAPGLAVAYTAKKTDDKEKRNARLDAIGEEVQTQVSLDDISYLSQAVAFLEDYAASLDSKLEIVACEGEYYISTHASKTDAADEE